ncbi:hypothetical protein [Streptomyces sp. NBC_01431]|uniref:hypothetical protein n=1 Tax=Streptomyces sp. NBC_01431 TaxID=2903863 RepID=UPI002E314D85|nr:hypothetical protein [Streptomyces sp. NBC_01431]
MTDPEPQATAAQAIAQAMDAALVVLAVGAPHCVIQQIRRDHEQRRVRADEQRHLASED